MFMRLENILRVSIALWERGASHADPTFSGVRHAIITFAWEAREREKSLQLSLSGDSDQKGSERGEIP